MDEIIFTVQPAGLIITVSPATKEQYAATRTSEKSDVMWMKERHQEHCKKQTDCFNLKRKG